MFGDAARGDGAVKALGFILVVNAFCWLAYSVWTLYGSVHALGAVCAVWLLMPDRYPVAKQENRL